jgi:hypothetical protein
MSHESNLRDRYRHQKMHEMHIKNRFRQRNFQYYQQKRQRSRVFFGITVAILGVLFLLRTFGYFPFDWEDSWEVVLIIVGTLIGIKSGFRNHAWWILILIGSANLIPEFRIMGHSSEQLLWPVVMIIAGLMVALRPRRHTFRYDEKRIPNMETKINAADTLNVDVVFGGRKEIVTSKNFRGGVVSATFGGADINLMQADSPDPEIIMEFKISFGGAEIIVPSHWEIQNEISPSFGSVDDERIIQTSSTTEERKKLILRGSCSFGSIEIKSY